jgi:hypothetical protein
MLLPDIIPYLIINGIFRRAMHKLINKLTKHERGFSMLELAVAVGIAAIVAVVGVTASTVFINGSTDTSQTYEASADEEINNARASYDALWDGVPPPTAPLSVEVSNVGVETATISWVPPAPSSGSGEIENYILKINGTTVATVETNILTYNLTNLIYSSEYTVTVTAVNPNGAAESSPVTFQTLARPVETPFAPLNVQVNDITHNNATVTWSEPASLGDNTIDRRVASYEVRLDGDIITIVEGNVFEYEFTGLLYSKRYDVTIVSSNSAGNTSSLPVTFNTTARPVAAPLMPRNLTVSDITSNEATFTWEAPASQGDNTIDRRVDSYEVRINGQLVATTNSTTLTASTSNLLYSTAYTVTVTAVNTAGETSTLPLNFDTTARPIAAPFAPRNVTVSDATTQSATVTWDAPVTMGDNSTNRTVVSYKVSVNETVIATVDADIFALNLTGLTYSTAYTVSIAAVNTAGETATLPVNFSTIARPIAAPLIPRNLTVSGITANNATFTWDAPVSQGDNNTDRRVDSYEVRVNDQLVATTNATTFTATTSNLMYSTAYSVTVTAVNTTGGTETLPVNFSTTARPLAAPFAPRNLVVTGVAANNATVTWDAPASMGDNSTDRTVTNYQVRLGTALVGTTNSSTFTLSLTGLTYSSAYSVTVTAVNTAGETATLPVNFSTTARPIAAPLIPRNLTVSGVTANDATFTWDAPASLGDNNNDRTVVSYQVRVNDQLVATTNATTFTASTSNLMYSTAYTVTVTAVNTAGSTETLPVNFSTIARPLAAPFAPRNLAVTGVTATGATFTWDTPVSLGDNSTDRSVVNYEVRVSGELIATTNSTTFTASTNNLLYSTAYSVMITSVNNAGETSTLPVNFNTTARPIAAPFVPRNIVASSITATTAIIEWEAPSSQGDNNNDRTVVSYQVRVNGNIAATVAENIFEANITGLSPNTSYSIKVAAINSAGETSGNVTFITANTIVATGGAITTFVEGNVIYNVHSFTDTVNSTFSVTNAPTGATVEYLIVGGGGGGGGAGAAGGAAGGGGGGVLHNVGTFGLPIATGTYPVVVGQGGNGGAPGLNSGFDGGTSSVFGITSSGGGGGGGQSRVGNNGASGGGGGGTTSSSTLYTGGAGISGQGFAGGTGGPGSLSTGQRAGGGGGGASQMGANALSGQGGNGGNGSLIYISNNFAYYGGGGGGGVATGTDRIGAGTGGLGGGGNGNTGNGFPGAANTGGGGGGAGGNGTNVSGGAGGSGVVMIKYIAGFTSTDIEATGGTITTVQEGNIIYRVHSFKNTGTFDFNVTKSPNGAQVEYLIVGGGGGGGTDLWSANRSAGGGGGGGVLSGNTNISEGTYAITVGAGGAGATGLSDGDGVRGSNGENSSAFNLTAFGGGGGAGHGSVEWSISARAGGSGGGGTHSTTGGPPGSGISGQGFSGRNGNSSSLSDTSIGLDGIGSAISGSLQYFGGGGAGSGAGQYIGGGGGGAAGTITRSAYNGGLGGGGASGYSTDAITGGRGLANSGGGGGASREVAGGNGGSGTVIVRYIISRTSTAISATGGNISITAEGNLVYRVHSFVSTGTSSFNILNAPVGSQIEYLVVGGGGAGGGDIGGGGGAGGIRFGNTGASSGSYSVTVGSGGQGSLSAPDNPNGSRGGNGSASRINLNSEIIEALGGGGGGGYQDAGSSPQAGTSGASGGGGGYSSIGGVGISGQGNNGGAGNNVVSSGRASGGGGGGYASAGSNGPTQDTGGNGGNGITSTITGTPILLGGGGGGGIGNNSTGNGGLGGPGGGGRGGKSLTLPSTPGEANTGGGGGGAFGGPTVGRQAGSSGGSGVVIIRYIIGTMQ